MSADFNELFVSKQHMSLSLITSFEQSSLWDARLAAVNKSIILKSSTNYTRFARFLRIHCKGNQGTKSIFTCEQLFLKEFPIGPTGEFLHLNLIKFTMALITTPHQFNSHTDFIVHDSFPQQFYHDVFIFFVYDNEFVETR